jgi:uncharacterized protein YutE (UPF0331/DUF86 family)
MTDRSIVLQKLATLRDHVERVRRRRPDTAATLRHDLDLQDAIALSLLVAIQEATDVAFHIVSDEGWGVPASYAESFTSLANHGVVGTDLAGLSTLEEFTAAVARYLGAGAA